MLDFTIPIYSILRHHLLEHYLEYQIRLVILMAGIHRSKPIRDQVRPVGPRAWRIGPVAIHGSLINGFLAPQLAGYIIRNNEYTIDGWSNVWWTCLVLQIIGGSFYAAVASADRQPWADEPTGLQISPHPIADG